MSEKEDREIKRAARNGKYTYICKVHPSICRDVKRKLEHVSDGIVQLKFDANDYVDIYLAGADEETIGTEEAACWARYVMGWADGAGYSEPSDLAMPRPGFSDSSVNDPLYEQIVKELKAVLGARAWTILGTAYGWARGMGADHDQAARFVLRVAHEYGLEMPPTENNDG